MKRPVPAESASELIDEKIKKLGDWRGKALANVREIIHAADPEIVEEWKWVKPTNPGTPVWSHGGPDCAGPLTDPPARSGTPATSCHLSPVRPFASRPKSPPVADRPLSG